MELSGMIVRGLGICAMSAALAGCATGSDEPGDDDTIVPGPDAGSALPGIDAGDDTAGFIDIDDSPFALEIRELAALGRIVGVSEDRFDPDACVERSEWAALLTRGLQLRAPATCEPPYSDVSADTAGCAAIVAARDAGFLSGHADGTFQPDQPLLRFQALVSVTAGAGLLPADAGERADDPLVAQYLPASWAGVPDWARYAVAIATRDGLNAYVAKSLEVPVDGCTRRDEAAGLIWRYLRNVAGVIE